LAGAEIKNVKTIEENSPTGPREIMATMRDVTMTYDGYQTRALAHVNLDFRRGEVVAVLGAKGAGKSTVLRILAGRLRPTEGIVKVFGSSPRRGSAKARVGYLPGKVDLNQPPGFFSRLFGRKKESSSSARGVTRLTQAILGNRELLILDDPFAGLDPEEMSETKALVRDMAGRGKTVILSSDSLMDVKELAQRIVIFHEGRVQAAGTLAELLASGGAIRFLPAVLPREVVERVLNVLREEIFGEPVPAQTTAPPAKTTSMKTLPAVLEKNATAIPSVDQLLTPLTRPIEIASPASSAPKPNDPIDHEKLEELTKHKKPE
jgi:ABC-type multidrug transport system ATPase subunit